MDAKLKMSSYVTPLVVSAVGIIFFTLAIAVYHCILLKYFLRPHQRTQRGNDKNITSRSRIKNNVGVQQDILSKIPVFSISTQTASGAIHLDQNECSICLGQWEDEDAVRLLPSCKHVFHRPCIDAWFLNHTNCPVCRSPITCDHRELALPIEYIGEQRVLHVHENIINTPSNHHRHEHPLINDDVSGFTPRFQRQRPMLHHTLSLSSHMRRKSRGLVMGLKRSLSVDQTTSYIAITIQRDKGEASTSYNSSSTKGIMMSQYNYRSRSRMHLDHVSSLLIRSFSQFQNSASGRYNAILPY